MTSEKRSNKNIPIDKALKLHFQHGLSYAEISRQLGCSRQYISKVLKPFKNLVKNPQILDVYRQNRSDLLNATELELVLDLLDSTRRKKASLNNVAYAFQQIHNARRLEEGLSTGNLAINVAKSLTTAHEKAQKMRDKLRKSAAKE
jgi:DNA-directed RNA polymerase specialized sigma24 family protein